MLIPFMVRQPTEAPVVQAQDEQNQRHTVRPELAEGLIQGFLSISLIPCHK